MIERASDPNASGKGWRPSAAQGSKAAPVDPQRSRGGHAWPFLSREVPRPQAKDVPTNTRSDSGS